MTRRQKVPKLVNLAVMTTITIFAWIFFDVYRAIRKTPQINVDEAILSPIVPTLDRDTLSEIEKGVYFEKSSIVLPTPTPTTIEVEEIINVTETPTASPSSQPEI
ncbi:MAG TPA: hypothetical protein VI819_04455 [Patescibacteria group bacterium]|nr:hypothetical protein [Patescibacteria group bacterium]